MGIQIDKHESVQSIQYFLRVKANPWSLGLKFCYEAYSTQIFRVNVKTTKCEYIKKVEQLFSDPTKFKIIDDPDPHMIQKLEKAFNDNLHDITDVIVKENDPNYRLIVDSNDKKIYEIKTKGSINQQTYKQLRSAGAKCAVAYGTTKVHKKDYPIRPIISTIGTYNYATAGYLSMILEENFNAPKANNSTDNVNSNITWNPPKRASNTHSQTLLTL